ncbi:MAG: relaxase [Ferruginibacter sp.]|uniref:relaxase/mobilization nuclease domain-containing protein n=1 Tax=Ferruginibacter sp. TaxID=1940288 RepID=UPI00265B4E0D|nr:relaxase/mobilization nuclease domain-containing protein [Ferruginibacter sp.]MDB5276144.1 relaxase [Ferruginibacter sp.]
MVAKINSGKSISKALNYNEQKVQQGRAELLEAANFLKEAKDLNFYEKMLHFERHLNMNERASTNSLHVSLNFDVTEKLSNEKMVEIAAVYMEKIGFGHQPYLVYRHQDAGHPHLHIVSTNIERNGKRISMHNLGKNQSEKARKEIEVDFKLVKAENHKLAQSQELLTVDAKKISYGKSETKRAISNVLATVYNTYKYTSLPEYNAVLQLYNVIAERGAEDSRMFKQRGLNYRVLNEAGNKVGTPIKASAFYMKPTLANLEKKFAENDAFRMPYQKKLQTTIGWILHQQLKGLEDFARSLEKQRINVVLRRSAEGQVYGITYVDHASKTVFNGSELGKEYSAKAVLEKCGEMALKPELLKQKQVDEKKPQRSQQKDFIRKKSSSAIPHAKKPSKNILDTVLRPSRTNDFVPQEFLQKKKKRKYLSL